MDSDRSVPVADHKLESYFTNATEPLDQFKTAIRAPQLGNKRILAIQGEQGAGKSALLEMYALECARNGNPVGLAAGGSAHDPIEVLVVLAKGLRQSGSPLDRFEALYTKYDAIRHALQQHPLSSPEVGPMLRPEQFQGAIDDTLAGPSGDLELYQGGVAKLTESFLDGLKGAADRKRIVLLVDEWERFGSTDTKDWFRDWLANMPANVLVVLAGRETPVSDQSASAWSGKWPGWLASVWPYSLHELVATDATVLGQRYSEYIGYAGYQAQATQILRWSGGNPELILFAINFCYQNDSSPFETILPKLARERYDRLIEGAPPELRPLLPPAAIFRSFNPEMLRQLAEPSLPQATLDQFCRSIFVKESGEALTVPSHLRDALNGKLRLDEPSRFAGLHGKAAELYRSKRDASTGSDWGRYELERLYHEFQRNASNGAIAFRNSFEDAFFSRRDFDLCRAILNEFASYPLDKGANQWVRYFEGLMAIYLETEPDKPREIMEELSKADDTLDTALYADVLEYLAAIYWYYNQRVDKGTEMASKLYDKCLILRVSDSAGEARVWIWKGILAQRVQGNGENEFQKALNLCASLTGGRLKEQTIAWAEQELSICYRMRGRFLKSEELIKSAARRFHELSMPFDEAGALINHAMLLIWLGRLHEAQSEVEKTELLYGKSPRLREQEKTWILVGKGNIALARRDFEEAARLFQTVIDSGKGDDFRESLGRGALAECRLAEGKWDEACDLGTQCLPLQQRIHDKFGEGWTLHTIGLAHAGAGNYTKALDTLETGRELMEDYGSAFGMSRLLSGRCEVQAQKGDRDEFDKTAKEVQAYNRENPFYDHLAGVAFWEGQLALREPAACFAEALEAAARYSPYLLDWMLTEILRVLSAQPDRRIAILNDICGKWVGDSMPEIEKSRQLEEYRPMDSRKALLDRIREQFPAVVPSPALASRKLPAAVLNPGERSDDSPKKKDLTEEDSKHSVPDKLDPLDVLKSAAKANPTVGKWLWAAVGLAAAAAIMVSLLKSVVAALESMAVVLVVMLVLLLFSSLTERKRFSEYLAAGLFGSLIVLVVAVMVLTVSSIFFGVPKPFPELIEQFQMIKRARIEVDVVEDVIRMPIPNATVVLEGIGSALTNAEGKVTFNGVPITEKRLTAVVSATGFQESRPQFDPAAPKTYTVLLSRLEVPAPKPLPVTDNKQPRPAPQSAGRLSGTWQVVIVGDINNVRISEGTFQFRPQQDGEVLVNANFRLDDADVTLTGRASSAASQLFVKFTAKTNAGGNWEGRADFSMQNATQMSGRLQAKNGDRVPVSLKRISQ
jgi:tetratricopeptide (TPR) repeat protein